MGVAEGQFQLAGGRIVMYGLGDHAVGEVAEGGQPVSSLIHGQPSGKQVDADHHLIFALGFDH